MELTPQQEALSQIFFSTLLKKQNEIKENNTRFVHYTSAEVAVSWFKNKEVWMREASTMNDFMEIDHGLECLQRVYKSELKGRLEKLLDSVSPGLEKDSRELFDSWLPNLRSETYLTCISEHDDKEDVTGRLSMWRAYGGETPVAIVLNNSPFFLDTDLLQVYSAPVSYLDPEGFVTEFEKVVTGMEENIDLLKEFGAEHMKNTIFYIFKHALLHTKHPGFHEEKEWRLCYLPKLQPSEKIVSDVQVIRGIPQIIHKIPLKNYPDEGLEGIELHEIIDRIIIGPTEYPTVIRRTFTQLLEEAGVKDVANKVTVSDIPLRNS